MKISTHQFCGLTTVFKMFITTDETHYPLPNWAHIHYTISIVVQQLLTNVNDGNLFQKGEFSESFFLSDATFIECSSATMNNKAKNIWVIGRKF